MTPERDQAIRESIARIQSRAAEFMVEHHDLTTRECIHLAMMEEIDIYGTIGHVQPSRICSRVRAVKD